MARSPPLLPGLVVLEVTMTEFVLFRRGWHLISRSMRTCLAEINWAQNPKPYKPHALKPPMCPKKDPAPNFKGGWGAHQP